MSKITKSARGQSCTVRIPSICNGNNETVVLAHINGVRFGHGIGQKVNDAFGAYACSSCHDAVDGRTPTQYRRAELKLMHLEGVIETQAILMQEGLIKCA